MNKLATETRFLVHWTQIYALSKNLQVPVDEKNIFTFFYSCQVFVFLTFNFFHHSY